MSPIRKITLVAAVAGLLALPAASFGQSPSLEGYSGSGPKVVEDVSGTLPETVSGGSADVPAPAGATAPAAGTGGDEQAPAAQVTATEPAGKLPFTGFDLAIVAVLGLALLGLGVGLRRLVRPETI